MRTSFVRCSYPGESNAVNIVRVRQAATTWQAALECPRLLEPLPMNTHVLQFVKKDPRPIRCVSNVPVMYLDSNVFFSIRRGGLPDLEPTTQSQVSRDPVDPHV